MSIVLDFLVTLASSRFINPWILPNPHPTFPYFFAPLSLKVTYTEAFTGSLVRINNSPPSPLPSNFHSCILIRVCPGLIYLSSMHWALVICRFSVPSMSLYCWRPFSHALPKGLRLFEAKGACSSRALVFFPGEHSRYLGLQNPLLKSILSLLLCGPLPLAFLQRADLPLGCSLLGRKSSCYCSGQERVQGLDVKVGVSTYMHVTPQS